MPIVRICAGLCSVVVCVNHAAAREEPLSVVPDWSAFGGQDGAFFGDVVAPAGDVNGDGYSDVIVGARLYDNGNLTEGRAQVYHGSANGLSTTHAWSVEGNQDFCGFATSVATAGDVNGDGYSDVVVGAWTYDTPTMDAGRVFVYHGSATGLSTSASRVLSGSESGAYFGRSVSTAGDVNGDGYSDIVVGAPGVDVTPGSDTGRWYIYLGSASGISATASYASTHTTPEAGYGSRVGFAGDVNGDGYGDVIIGVPDYSSNQSDEGRVGVYLGSATGVMTLLWLKESNLAGDQYGWSVGCAGDVNADGYSDIVIGAPGHDAGLFLGAGRAYVHLGSAVGPSQTPDWAGQINQVGGAVGSSVFTAGDVNGDGYSDVIVGARLYDNGELNEGVVAVFMGGASGLNEVLRWTGQMGQSSANFGVSVATAGDVNGDGYSDVIVGASGFTESLDDEGAAFVFHGSSLWASSIAARTTGSEDAGVFSIGGRVAGAGDVNGDGFDDLLVTANSRVSTYHGSAAGAAGDAAWEIEVDQLGGIVLDNFRDSVAGAGDVNGDGYDDVIVGAPGSNAAGTTITGRAIVFSGSINGLEQLPDWNVTDGVVYSYFGAVVTGLGDVNGDGFADVGVGASGHINRAPRVHVYHGSATGLPTTASYVLDGAEVYDAFGSRMESAGDVNGDGFDDVLISSSYYSDLIIEQGRAAVYLGSATGLSAMPSWEIVGMQKGSFRGLRIGGAGDVNGDGYSDVLVGEYRFNAPHPEALATMLFLGASSGLGLVPAWEFVDGRVTARLGGSITGAGDLNQDGYSDVVMASTDSLNGGEGEIAVFHGSPKGLSAEPSLVFGAVVENANTARRVAGAGDLNGDGAADFAVGSPMYPNGSDDEGRFWVHHGSGSGGVAVRTRQLRADNLAPIASTGISDDETSFRIAATAKGFLGRSEAKLEIEMKPMGALMDGSGLRSGALFLSTGVAGVELNELVTGLSPSTPYHWRARIRFSISSSPFQMWGRWVTPQPSGLNERDIRTGTSCSGDLNASGAVNGADLSVLLGQFQQSVLPGTGADLNRDGHVNGADLSVLLGRFGVGC